MPTITSPFLQPGPLTTPSTLSILHLKRDLLLPTVLLPPSAPTDGYAEGPVTNTRFGSFPHSTLIDIPWGSQVRASAVDTGSRGRKRKRSPAPSEIQPQQEVEDNTAVTRQFQVEEAEAPQHIKKSTTHRGGKSAQKREEQKQEHDQGARQGPSGFIHILPPTPESWTLGLPHRTQVVYTPDYSYILHKLRVRPGTRLIEAGAGSGSFTHAAARAVFGPASSTSTSTSTPPFSTSPSTSHLKADDDGGGGVDATIPTTAGAAQSEENDDNNDDDDHECINHGKVHSYEFHAPRHEKLAREIHAHGLADTVTLHLRDVCASGFQQHGTSDAASAIFLDLPAPWLALPHLTRASRSSSSSSPLDPTRAARICTFSPCIEQVDRTISALRKLGWVDIEMSALAARRIEVRREKVGVGFAGRRGERGISGHPCDVGEAVGRGREVEQRGRKYHERMAEKGRREEGEEQQEEEEEQQEQGSGEPNAGEETAMQGDVKVPAYKEGRLVTRSETEIKEHTSYLVFAVLPMAWTEEDETRAAEKAARMGKEAGQEREMSRAMGKKARKRAAKEAAEGRNKGEDEAEAGGAAVKLEGEGDGLGDVKITVEPDGAASVDEGGDVKMEEAEQSLP